MRNNIDLSFIIWTIHLLILYITYPLWNVCELEPVSTETGQEAEYTLGSLPIYLKANAKCRNGGKMQTPHRTGRFQLACLNSEAA